ncbi:MAG: thioredoxin family protein [Caldimonas sp.]
MPFEKTYATRAPERTELEALEEPALIEFGTPWCGWCRAAQPLIAAALAEHPQVRHVKVEDGSGRPLGRAFRVKLWPTLIFLKRGQEVARLVRPDAPGVIARAMAQIVAADG